MAVDVFNLMARISLDTEDYKRSLGDAGKETSSFADKFGKGLKSAGVAVGAIAATAGVAMVALGKQVVTAYADYEQLVGGIETLFGGANVSVEEFAKTNNLSLEQAATELAHYGDQADAALQHASEAYKTAGLSSNEYMEIVTGFSASLISSLGENSYQAANFADSAVTQMADNANKMGTDMESIQNAYQGFAKQNYTMLDNLKLGYGGTKEEMERLLRDAEKYGGFVEGTFDAANFADITVAIGVIQDELGVTGTTAQEAEKTISGSVNTMKAAWRNLLVGLGDANADVSSLAKNVTSAFGSVVKNIAPVLMNIVSALPTVLETIGPTIMDMLPMLLETVATLFSQVFQMLVESIPQLIPVFVSAVLMITDTLVANLPLLISAAVQVVVAITQGIASALPELIPAIVEAVILIVDTLISNVDMLVDAAIAITMALAVGLINALPILIEKAPEILVKLVQAIVENVPKLLEAAWEIISTLVTGIVENLGSLGETAADMVETIAKGIKELVVKIWNIGKNIVRGVWEGIKSMADWFWQQIKGFFSGIIDSVMNFLGINSPSKVFAGIGENMALGLGKGFTTAMEDVSKAINTSIPTSIDINAVAGSSGSNGGGAGNTLNIYTHDSLSEYELMREFEDFQRRLAWQV